MLLLGVTAFVSAHFALVEVLGDDTTRASGVRVSLSHVITNEHVVAHARSFWVACSQTKVEARVVATDAALDLALLELEDPERCATSFAVFRSLGALPGERLVARGCPYGRCGKVRHGEVLARLDIGGQDRIVTSIYVRPGSSGGPAYDEEGDVVGIVYAYSFEASDHTVSYGLLIPVDRVLSFVLGSCNQTSGTRLTLHVGTALGEHYCPSQPSSIIASRLDEVRLADQRVTSGE